MEGKKKCFIIVAWYGGIPYMLQYGNVVNWYFHNNRIRLFKTIDSAKKNAYKVSARFKYDMIKVYSISEGEMVCTDNIRKWDRNEAKRVVFELVKK